MLTFNSSFLNNHALLIYVSTSKFIYNFEISKYKSIFFEICRLFIYLRNHQHSIKIFFDDFFIHSFHALGSGTLNDIFGNFFILFIIFNSIDKHDRK